MSIYIKLNWMHCTLTTRVESHRPALTTVQAVFGWEREWALHVLFLSIKVEEMSELISLRV